jgi:hypothetical protein
MEEAEEGSWVEVKSLRWQRKKNGVHGQIDGEVCFWGEQFLAE